MNKWMDECVNILMRNERGAREVEYIFEFDKGLTF
jgi:hypothetical protein